ncbi:MAG: hypothetical protein IKK75_12070 [Clostridia bacterium]|nr:hypothetical protein [Clostridia bacterium]
MPDWNGDGKDNYHDDYVYHEVFGTKKTAPAPGKFSGGWIWKVIAALAAWELLNLIADLMY